ncbi:MAG: AMP-dependent synthetase, partial [Cyanobacteria bacterium J06649_11]
LNTPEITNAVRQVIMQKHQLSPYAIVLIKTGSLPKTSSGKVKRHACRQDFLSNRLLVVGDWAETPIVQSKFRALESEIEKILTAIPDKTFSIMS